MKAVIGILLIFAGFAIDYFVVTGKLPPQGGITPPSGTPPLPTASSVSNTFSATTGQGTTSGNTPASTTTVGYQSGGFRL